ncbi:LTA synthase family protein [Inconstantimicrobium mannanitabidum]|uniref:Phosphoglycerol transferase n=1 Tax=Inconstantimicrobium mannanitabidum TaxID=1604901 RepID=A0ACB5RF34_9CLOT|nr:LTA synthase family protein [Clostridium sp. TW13]GKX67780.1 phosphoglycerol transferase [Clostridium sp. TW13]
MIRKIDLKFKLAWGMMILAFLKDILFISLMYSSNADIPKGVTESNFTTLVQIFIILIIFAPGLFFKEKGRDTYSIIILTVFSAFLLIDLWCYRGTWDLYGLKYIFFDNLFNKFHRSLVNPCMIDILFVFDLPIFYYMFIKKYKYKGNTIFRGSSSYEKSALIRIIKGSVTLVFSIAFILVAQYLVQVKDISKGKYTLFTVYWSPHSAIKSLGPVGYHINEISSTLQKLSKKENATDIAKAKQWIQANAENLPDNEYYSMFKGKNVVFIQLESFEQFILNQKVYGQEITPNLNRLMKNSLNFNNIYEQNNAGNSIDCDFLVNSSVFTLGTSITGLTHEEVKFEGALPRILERAGYTTATGKVERGLDWNWGEVHGNGFGVQNLWDEKDYIIDDYVGFGLSDKSVLNQFRKKIETLKQPFSAFTVTLTTHGPFDMTDNMKGLKLPKNLDDNMLGKYFQGVHYTDEQLGQFVNDLDKDGLLENTVIVMYGDHGGVHKYYNDQIQSMNLEGDWWRNYDHKIPFMIYSKGLKSKTFDSPGGQADFYPTLAYVLGLDKKQYQQYVMGRSLVNTKRTATVIAGNQIKGTPSTQEEKEHLLNAYDVGRIIIENNMFK